MKGWHGYMPSFSKTYLWNQHLVARLHTWLDDLSLLVKSTGANGQHTRLVELLDGRLREEDASCGLGLGLDALDEDAVEEGSERLDGLESGRLLEQIS